MFDDVPVPEQGRARRAASAGLDGLDPSPDPVLDRLITLASALCGSAVGLLPQIDADRRSRDCPQAIRMSGPAGDPGEPPITDDAHCVSPLYMINPETAQVTDEQLSQLVLLAAVAADVLETRAALKEARTAGEAHLSRISELEFAQSLLEGQATQLVELVEDREELHQRIKRQSKFIETLIQTIPIPIFARDTTMTLTHANRAYAHFHGVDPEGLQGAHLDAVLGAERLLIVEAEDRLVLAEPTGRGSIEMRVTLDGPRGARDVIVYKAVIRADDGSALGFVGAIVDVTESNALRSKLELAAATDPLTGAPNRRSFMDKAEVERARSVRSGRPMSLIMIDIDNFKAINDVYGHQAGDEVLKRVAAVCMNLIRDSVDLFARLGGEEFAVVLPETTTAGAVSLAQRLRRAIANERVDHEGRTIRLTASFGVAQVEVADHGHAIDEALKRADSRLYESKRSGRDRVTAHGDGASAPSA